MTSALELIERYAVKKNPAVEAFIAEVNRIKTAIEKKRLSGRSPVRAHGSGFKFSLLSREMEIDDKETAIDLLDKLIAAAGDESDADFRLAVEVHHGEGTSEEKPKRTRRKKGEKTEKDSGFVGNG